MLKKASSSLKKTARSSWKKYQKSSFVSMDPAKAQSLVIHKDSDIIALNKPSGLAVQGSVQSGELDIVSQLGYWQYNSPKRPALGHRIDRNTTGVLLLTRHKESARRIRELFEQKEIIKRYWAITVNVPSKSQDSITVPISTKNVASTKSRHTHKVILRHDKLELFSEELAGKRLPGDIGLAWTKYTVLDHDDECHCSLLDIELVTGFKHQIRVHLADHLNCPVLGDYKFAGPVFRRFKNLAKKMEYIGKQRGYTRGPVYLHAYEVQIPRQERGKPPLVINAPLPMYFVDTLNSLGLRLPKKYVKLMRS